MPLILSLFPGARLFDRAFEAEGFCVLAGPDLLYGNDIRSFQPPRRCAWGIIAGSPCQDFSSARRGPPSGDGCAMLAEFVRVVEAVGPDCWVLENVPSVPDVHVPGYSHQRIDVQQAWFNGVRRLRHFQFGSAVTGPNSDPVTIDVPRGHPIDKAEPAALANDSRSFAELCRLQGLPPDFDLPGFTVQEKKHAVGNGVPILLGRVIARAIRRAYNLPLGPDPIIAHDPAQALLFAAPRICLCKCGRPSLPRGHYASAACRKRAQRKRDAAGEPTVTRPLATA